MTICINGNPMPKNFTIEQFTEKYKTTNEDKGMGIGGNDIKKIAELIFSDWRMFIDEDLLKKVTSKKLGNNNYKLAYVFTLKFDS